MKTFCFQIFILLLISSFFSACSVVKRDGFYQSRKYNHKTAKNWKAKHKRSATHPTRTATVIIPSKGSDKLVLASTNVVTENDKINTKDLKQLLKASRFEQQHETLFLQNEQSTQTDSCDLLVLRNGDEIEAKVTEISSSEVKYKRCNHLNGPTIIIDKNEVLFVKYSNGEKEVFTVRQTNVRPQQSRVEPQTRTQNTGSPALRGVGIALLIIGILFMLAVSIVLGLIIGGFGLLFMAVGKS